MLVFEHGWSISSPIASAAGSSSWRGWSGAPERSCGAKLPGPPAPRGPFRSASASWPCLSLSAASPNNSRRQPCSAPTSGIVVRRDLFEIVDVAITLLATAWRSDVIRSSTFRSSTMAASLELLRCFSIFGSVRGRARYRAARRRRCRRPFRAVESLRQGTQTREPFQAGGRVGGDIADRVVLQYAAARNVAALRLLLAPAATSISTASSFGLRTRVFSRSRRVRDENRRFSARSGLPFPR